MAQSQSETLNASRSDEFHGLGDELERLKDLTGFGKELTVEWCRAHESPVSGKVEGSVIYVFEPTFIEAIKVLRHEFLDYLVSLAVKPYEKAASYYRAMVNSLIRELGEEAYNDKERVVEALVKIMNTPSV